MEDKLYELRKGPKAKEIEVDLDESQIIVEEDSNTNDLMPEFVGKTDLA